MSAKMFLTELEQEFIATGNLLELVPDSHLSYKPHVKAMSLGQLALHVATIPGKNLQFAKDGSVETLVITEHPIPSDKNEILKALEESKHHVRNLLNDENTSWLKNDWKLLKSTHAIANMPTYAFVRTFVLNHWYHHRGQLTTYLRILNKELPSVYGPTADIDPFA